MVQGECISKEQEKTGIYLYTETLYNVYQEMN